MNPLERFSKTTVNYKLTDMDNLINFQDNYYCFDNLQMGFDPKIKAVSQQGNDDFHIVIAVQQGNMGLIINGQEVRMKSNDFLIIMPFTKVEVLTSRCTVFCCVIRNYIALDMYNKIGCPDNIVENCYTFHHYHFHPQQLEIMQHDYLRIKDIMLRQAPSWLSTAALNTSHHCSTVRSSTSSCGHSVSTIRKNAKWNTMLSCLICHPNKSLLLPISMQAKRLRELSTNMSSSKSKQCSTTTS